MNIFKKKALSGNKCNGYRPGRTYCHGRTLTFRIPRDRYGNIHLRILAILFMGKTAMDKKSYLRQIPRIDLDRNLFPDD